MRKFPGISSLNDDIYGAYLESHTTIKGITAEEIHNGARKMENNRSPGPDGITAEFWKVVLAPDSPAANRCADFCNMC